MIRSIAKILSLVVAVICLFFGIVPIFGVVPTPREDIVSHIVLLSFSAILGLNFVILERKAKGSTRTVALGITVLVTVLAVAAFIMAPTIHWNGRVFRQVNVNVQTGDGSPIAGAKVTFRGIAFDWAMEGTNVVAHMTATELESLQNQHCAYGMTDAFGRFAFRAMFPAGGTIRMFRKNGRVTLYGTVTVEADGYKTLERPLRDLAGQGSLPVRSHRRRPIVIHCKLEDS